ncbi:MAG: FG-GAP repeat protein [Planctomycetes bacterium]|nr:FG-GAP repeat protein [Planctomycetota bacterium]
MKAILGLGSFALALSAATLGAAETYEFEAPELLTAGGEAILTEAPGYAAPCLADIDGDGVRDLLVGQFKSGKINFYKGLKSDDGTLKFAKQQFLQADGEDAVVPGVW